MKLKIFCRGSLFPSWSGQGLISTPVNQKWKQSWHVLRQYAWGGFCSPRKYNLSIQWHSNRHGVATERKGGNKKVCAMQFSVLIEGITIGVQPWR